MYAALRKLKILVGSGGLDFTKGMDSLNKHVQQISFRQCVTVCEHRQLKGWQPHIQLTRSSISALVRWLAAVSQHNWQHNHCIVTILWDHNSVTKPSASLHMTGFFCSCNEGMGMMQPWFNAEMAERTRLSKSSSFCQGVDAWNSHKEWWEWIPEHVQNISVRQCITFCEHRQLKGWKPHFKLTVAKISISTIAHWFAAVS